MTKPSLEIDAAKVSLGEVWVHQQGDPSPGGHTFVLKVPLQYLGTWKDERTALASEVGMAKTELKMVRWEISNWPRQEPSDGTTRFVLNMCTEVKFEELAAVISGVCSPHLHAWA